VERARLSGSAPPAASPDAFERLAAWLDPGAAVRLRSPGAQCAVVGASGTLGGRRVVAGAVDARVARGAIGTDEAAALEALYRMAHRERCALVLDLDSAGARIDQGIAVLAAFRRLFGAALQARHASVPMIAVVGPHCYGGASMLASLAEHRIYTAASRLGMSGPRIVQAYSGKTVFDASDPYAVETLFGGVARATLSNADRLCAADTRRTALIDLLATAPQVGAVRFEADHAALFERLRQAGRDIPRNPRPAGARLKERLSGCLPQGFEALLGSGVVRGVRARAGQEATLTGLVDGAPLGAIEAWMIAESIITSVRARPDRPIVLLYDTLGHAATVEDEALLLSDYVTHLARSVLWARERGVTVSTWLFGEASGGAYVAFTAAADQVLAFPGSDLRILPQAAVLQVLGETLQPGVARAGWRALGLVDAVLADDTMPPALAGAAGLPG